MRSFSYTHAIVLILLIMACLALFMKTHQYSKQHSKPKYNIPSESLSCTIDTCGAIDPVNDPDYNMKNIVKQSILLEEHLAERNKYCISCIVKHFLHIIGLAEEATWMAGRKLEMYPFLQESVAFYTKLFETWLNHKHDEKVKQEVLDELRNVRRQLIDFYYLGEK